MRPDAQPTKGRALSHSRARRPYLRLARGVRVDKQRTGEKSTAVATRGASPRTRAIAHTYLYTVIFKMKERRAGGRCRRRRRRRAHPALTAEESAVWQSRADADRSHFRSLGTGFGDARRGAKYRRESLRG